MDGAFKGDGIERAKDIIENFAFVFLEVRIVDEPVERGARLIEGADGFGADETFFNEFERRFEEIVKEPKLVLIEIVE